MSLASLLSHWRSDPEISANIIEWRTIPVQAARNRPFPAAIHLTLTSVLEAQGIASLYIHQVAAWENAQNGYNQVIVTGTASGKTLCYHLPVLDHMLRDPEARALYLFPTKALSQDQSMALQSLLALINGQPSATHRITCAVYDGDTPASNRLAIRNNSDVIMSNPDMLHTGILPHHTAWAGFFRHLRYIVIDEMHVYRGVFGSHVANVLRRLRRITKFYGSTPQFILTSATIGNPGELAQRLIEQPVVLVEENGAARGAKHFLIYNPPIVNPDLGLRRSTIQESVHLADQLSSQGVQTIIFGRTRRTVEIILAYLKEDNKRLLSSSPLTAMNEKGEIPSIRGYRSGYLPSQRRQIEKGLRQGEVRIVVATNALELGIDIGGMGAAVLAGYPGTISATWQQAGRAGRGEASSLAILITSASPLDQFLAHHPEYFFGRTPERGLINPDNLLILLGHLRCAAFELPFQIGDGFGSVSPTQIQEFLDYLKDEGLLHLSASRYFWTADQYPAQGVSLRSASPEVVVLQAQGEDGTTQVIGEVDIPSANWMVHPGAIYMHEAQTYWVKELDLEKHIAQLEPILTDYYTQPRIETTVELVEKSFEEELEGTWKAHGDILVTSQVIGFRKVRWHTHENLGLGEVSLPPTTLATTGYWLSLKETTMDRLREDGFWNADPNRYGRDWSVQRDRARERDGFRCQVCGMPEQGRTHDVHHKIPFRGFGSPELANQLSNLVTLCAACHRRVEGAVRIRSGLAGLAYTLCNLAPLFLMCDTGDLGVHFDPQSVIADGQPMVVLYDQIQAGIGFSQRLYEIHDELMARAYELVNDCSCQDGCPSCVGPGGESGSGGKRETKALLTLLNIDYKNPPDFIRPNRKVEDNSI